MKSFLLLCVYTFYVEITDAVHWAPSVKRQPIQNIQKLFIPFQLWIMHPLFWLLSVLYTQPGRQVISVIFWKITFCNFTAFSPFQDKQTCDFSDVLDKEYYSLSVSK